MAADNEARLLSRAIRDRDIRPLLERGVHDSWFAGDDHRAVWRFLREHTDRYDEVPTGITVKDNYPNYRLLAVDDTLDYLLDQLVAYRRRQSTIRLLQDAGEVISTGGDAESAIRILSSGVENLLEEGVSEAGDLDLTSDPMSRYEQYLEIRNRPSGLLGLPTGFPTIDLATSGLQPGQCVVVIAPPKTGKSTLMMQSAIAIHEQGHSVMLQSFEMSNHEQQDRHDSMRAKISHTRLTRGELNPEESTRYRQMLKRTGALTHPFILTDSVTGLTVSSLAAKVNSVRPDVLFVDGVYLMIDEQSAEQGTPAALTNVSRSMKRLAQKAQIPVVISTQVLLWKMKNKNVSAEAIGYSSAFYQDADVILGLQRTELEDDPLRVLKVVASRNCGYAETDLIWDWETGTFAEEEDDYA